MANRHGDFLWYELMTTDAIAAQGFYSALLGWSFADSGQAEMDYRLASRNGKDVAGLMQISPEMATGGARPGWVGYIAVDDVDASAAAIEAAGGSVMMPAMDIPDVGRMAMVTDPQGAPFYIMKGAVEGGESTSFAADRPMEGHCAWNELATSDPKAAKQFYGGLFGWVNDGEMDMGEFGKYQFWKVGDERGHMLGAVMPLMPGMPAPAWSFYFRVPDIDSAKTRVEESGGQILQEPIEIPGGDFSLTAIDPQGAAICLVGARS